LRCCLKVNARGTAQCSARSAEGVPFLVAFRRIVDLPGILDHVDLTDVDVDELTIAFFDRRM
jgi:hypothetical protein